MSYIGLCVHQGYPEDLSALRDVSTAFGVREVADEPKTRIPRGRGRSARGLR